MALLALLVAAPLTLVPPMLARGGPVQDSERTSDALLEPSAKRILILHGGGIVRGRTRQLANGTWELARDGEWIAMPDGSVASTRLEDVVLDEYARRRKDLGSDAPIHGRLELAHWCEQNGLVGEALGQLDEAFEDRPGAPMVERHLDRFAERVRLGFGLPDAASYVVGEERERRSALDGALATASRLRPAARYLAGSQLVDAAGIEALRPLLDVDLRRGGPLARTLAAELMGRFATGEETKVLLVRAVLDSDPAVRAASARALGRTDEPGFLLPIERALYSNNPQVQANAAQALGAMGMPQALPLIANAILAPPSSGTPSGPRAYVYIGRQFAYVQDYDVEVATAASIADPQIGVLVEGSVLDVRVLATTIERTVVRRYLARSAGQLLGRDLGKKQEDWVSWAKSQLEESAEAPPVTGDGASGGE